MSCAHNRTTRRITVTLARRVVRKRTSKVEKRTGRWITVTAIRRGARRCTPLVHLRTALHGDGPLAGGLVTAEGYAATERRRAVSSSRTRVLDGARS